MLCNPHQVDGAKTSIRVVIQAICLGGLENEAKTLYRAFYQGWVRKDIIAGPEQELHCQSAGLCCRVPDRTRQNLGSLLQRTLRAAAGRAGLWRMPSACCGAPYLAVDSAHSEHMLQIMDRYAANQVQKGDDV